MQYLYDDVVPPLRFFTKIVMRCVNDALDDATAFRIRQQQQQNKVFAASTNIAADAPPLVKIPPGMVTFATAIGKKTERVNEGCVSFSENFISAIFVGHGVMLFGFADGHVTLAYGADDSYRKFEFTDIPPFAPNVSHVLSLSCMPFGEMKMTVAVGYIDKVYVCLVSLKKGNYYPMLLREKTQQRTVEITTADWAYDGRVSSLQLSSCSKYIAMAFAGCSSVSVAALPSLEVLCRTYGNCPQRVALDLSYRVVEDSCSTSGLEGNIFFIPVRRELWFQRSVHCSTPRKTCDKELVREECCLCFVAWVGSSNYSRCPLTSIRDAALGRLNTVLAEESSVANQAAKRVVFSAGCATAASNILVARRSRGRSTINLATSGNTLKSRSVMGMLPNEGRNKVRQATFTGIYKGMLFSRILAATLLATDSALVVLGTADGHVYLIDGYGATSMFFSLPSRVLPLRALSFFPFMATQRSMVYQAVGAIFLEGPHVTLAHVRGDAKSAAFSKCTAVRCLRKVKGLRSAFQLEELPFVILFCAHGVYLWDICYNRVVASLAGLPLLEPFVFHDVQCGRKLSGALRHGLAIRPRNELFLPLCTKSAIVWWTANGVLARLSISDLIGSVYPLLGVYFPGLSLCSVALLLERVLPSRRNMPEHMAAVELFVERQLPGSSSAGGVKPLANSGDTEPVCFFDVAALGLRPEKISADFLRSTCSSVGARAKELCRVFDPWRQR